MNKATRHELHAHADDLRNMRRELFEILDRESDPEARLKLSEASELCDSAVEALNLAIECGDEVQLRERKPRRERKDFTETPPLMASEEDPEGQAPSNIDASGTGKRHKKGEGNEEKTPLDES